MASQAPPQIMNKYRELLQESQRIASKIAELESDRNEHRLVEDTLRPLDPQRVAYRMIGGVLVERNVGEVLPSVTNNREQLEKAIATLQEKLTETQKEAAEIQTKYNIQTEPMR